MSIKKSLGLGLVLGLLAMASAALPAMAGAAQLTSGIEEPTDAPSTISATSTDAETVVPGFGVLVCEHVEVHGILEANADDSVVVVMDGEDDTAEGCELEGGSVSVKPTLEEINLSGNTGTAKFSFVVAGGLLEEESTATVAWTSPATMAKVEGPVTGSAEGAFSGHFSFSGEKGEPLTLD
jgi:hypothetical protein